MLVAIDGAGGAGRSTIPTGASDREVAKRPYGGMAVACVQMVKTAACDGGNDEFATLPRSIPAAQRRHLEDEMALDLFAGIPVTDIPVEEHSATTFPGP